MTDRKEKRGSCSQLSSALIEGLSSQSHVSISSRVRPVTQLSVIKAEGVFLKLFSSLTLAPVPSIGVPAASPDLPMRSAVSQSLYFHSFFISKTTTRKKGCFKYIYICVHVCFHSGQIYDLVQQNLVFVAPFSNVHENQVSQCNAGGRNHPRLNITLVWS